MLFYNTFHPLENNRNFIFLLFPPLLHKSSTISFYYFFIFVFYKAIQIKIHVNKNYVNCDLQYNNIDANSLQLLQLLETTCREGQQHPSPECDAISARTTSTASPCSVATRAKTRFAMNTHKLGAFVQSARPSLPL